MTARIESQGGPVLVPKMNPLVGDAVTDVLATDEDDPAGDNPAGILGGRRIAR